MSDIIYNLSSHIIKTKNSDIIKYCKYHSGVLGKYFPINVSIIGSKYPTKPKHYLLVPDERRDTGPPLYCT